MSRSTDQPIDLSTADALLALSQPFVPLQSENFFGLEENVLGDPVQIEVTATGFSPPELNIFGPTDVTWVNVGDQTLLLGFGNPPVRTLEPMSYLPVFLNSQSQSISQATLSRFQQANDAVILEPGESHTRRLTEPD
ncbi:hypothetical protein KFU94_18570 [Chloroflexi bacterium TSY]|nr:hypothetical protein [Chloroflexi bacterium TSY]